MALGWDLQAVFLCRMEDEVHPPPKLRSGVVPSSWIVRVPTTHVGSAGDYGPLRFLVLTWLRMAAPVPGGWMANSILTGIELLLPCVKGFIYWSVLFCRAPAHFVGQTARLVSIRDSSCALPAPAPAWIAMPWRSAVK